MADVVCLDLPPGPAFVEALERAWAAGAAVFPLDPRLPAAERAEVMATIAPTMVVEAVGSGRSAEAGEPRRLVGGQPTTHGDALVMATSGTAGRPKGVVLTADAVAASANATSAALEVDPTRDRWVACLPVAHIGGLSVITRSIVTGTPFEAHARFDATEVIAAADRGATLVSLVTRALHEIPTDRFRRILLGGAAPPPDRPANVIATYGMTETGSGIVYERRPIDGVELRIDDDEQIWVRGPMLLRAYRQGTADGRPVVETEPFDEHGWFPTGDLGTFADDGSLRVFGRRGDVIVTGGEKVWPERVEPLLRRHPDVADACVVGRPDEQWGAAVVAVVELAGSSGSDQEETVRRLRGELREQVKASLPVWYAPQDVVVVDYLPRTSLGKVRRGEVRAAIVDR